MSQEEVLPELRQIVGALIFGSDRPLTLNEIRACVIGVAQEDGPAKVFADVTRSDVRDAIAALNEDLSKTSAGFAMVEVAGGFRLQSDARCGRWLRHLLNAERPDRLSQPALETLAIIAYRQPVAKSVIESIRGVGVDHVIKMLMEMQLVRIVGRSELPGRPFLYGTTQYFLEHFGLKSMDDLTDLDPLLIEKRMDPARPSPESVSAETPTVEPAGADAEKPADIEAEPACEENPGLTDTEKTGPAIDDPPSDTPKEE